MKVLRLSTVALLAGALWSGVAIGQAYPSKPIKVIVPIAIGGPPDIAARAVAQKMSESIGQPMVVENRPGAGGTIGAQAAAKSPADGYTVFVGSVTSLALGPALFPKLGLDPVKLFAPVSLFTIAPSVIVISATIDAKNLQEFVALAKQRPGHFNFGAPTPQSPPFISGAQFAAAAGIKLVGVPFSNPAGVVNAMMNGEAHLFIETLGSVGGHIRAGKLRALAVAHSKRHPMLPDVPTAAEAGLPNFESGTWSGLLAPMGTPAPIIQRLNSEVHKAVASEEVRKLFMQQGGEPYPSTPEEFARLVAQEAPKWAKAIQLAGIKTDEAMK